MKKRRWILALALCLPFVLSADSLQEIKKRMAKRLPAISELKEKQCVGENKEGYLEVLKPANLTVKNMATVQDENSDRRVVYTFIAEQANATVQLVAQQRAAAIRKQSAPGIMVEWPNGTWKEKKK